MRSKRARTYAFATALGLTSGVASLVLAQDPNPGEKRRLELAYRWDLLDGKTAIYDAELVSLVAVERRSTTDGEDSGGEGAADAAAEKMEARTTTNERLSMAFSKDDHGRGRVRVSTERLQVSLTQVALGTTESLSYDSTNPPKEGIPEKLRATVEAMLGKPYTLVVGRRGEVESVEGRPASQLDSLKGTFLLLPEKPRAEGETWAQTLRQPSPPYGDFVTSVTYKLARVAEGADAAGSRLRIEATIGTELDDKKSTVPPSVLARIDDGKGAGHVDLDGRGLKLEEETSSHYSFVVKQVSLYQTNRFENRSHWKLVEVK
jgi:hypothetical protein